MSVTHRFFKKFSELVKSTGRETPAQKKKKEQIISYLNEKLTEAGINGVVRSIVRLNQKSRAICCYEHQIKPDILFVWLNPSIGINATKYPPTHDLKIDQCHSGVFVPLSKFENCDKKSWVALINIPLSDEELNEAIPFSPSPHPTWTRK